MLWIQQVKQHSPCLGGSGKKDSVGFFPQESISSLSNVAEKPAVAPENMKVPHLKTHKHKSLPVSIFGILHCWDDLQMQ